MRRALIILFAGLLAGITAYGVLYYRATAQHRAWLSAPTPELEWLKNEFHMNNAEFRRVCELHNGYLPQCAERCRAIAQKNSEMQKLLATEPVDKLAVNQKITEAAQLRADCQKSMFEHFLAVSQQMPPEQGRRYLQWAQQRIMPGARMADHEPHVMEHH